MNAIRIKKRLDSHVLTELIPMVGKQVEIIVLEEAEPRRAQGRKAGSAKGKITIAPDFDAPLEDFAEYMK